MSICLASWSDEVSLRRLFSRFGVLLPMFDALSDRFGTVFDRLRGRGALNEQDVRDAMREVRIALLEADVALPVVRRFIDEVTEKAVGQSVLRSVTPGQQVVKIVNDALVEMLGGEDVPGLDLNAAPPVVIMMVGLQGSGKTTTTAKLASCSRKSTARRPDGLARRQSSGRAGTAEGAGRTGRRGNAADRAGQQPTISPPARCRPRSCRRSTCCCSIPQAASTSISS
jgi:hypothetical protein